MYETGEHKPALISTGLDDMGLGDTGRDTGLGHTGLAKTGLSDTAGHDLGLGSIDIGALGPRKIIHFDMDAFYASIEMRDDPSLRGRPVVVGGSPNSRGVVCTASYEARRYGVRSAMACATAVRLCPDAVFVRPNFDKYRLASEQIRSIFAHYTALIEPLSLDEAYLDVTANRLGLYAVKIARLIQEEVLATTGLTGSAGVAPNKLVAKIASDLRKPHGISVVLPDQVTAFMGALPLRKIHGIGPASEKRLAAAGLHRCADVWPRSLAELSTAFGPTMAPWLYNRSRGLDDRPVNPSRERKSYGKESTYSSDLRQLDAVDSELTKLAAGLGAALEARQLRGRTLTLKVKYADFHQITRRQTFASATASPAELLALARSLLQETEAGVRPVRLLGLTVSNFTEPEAGSAEPLLKGLGLDG